jgi:pimeloyl-ACP methyl ester carboxylesterase
VKANTACTVAPAASRPSASEQADPSVAAAQALALRPPHLEALAGRWAPTPKCRILRNWDYARHHHGDSVEAMSKQTHYRSDLQCEDGKGIAYWAIEPEGKALVFVHGFGGDPSETWMQFDSMLEGEQACRGYDILYYGYNSLRRQVRPSGLLFRQFLEALDPIAVANRSIGETVRRNPLTYDRIILVAHSMGAVVSRIALISAYRENRPWLSHTKLILFAPAHRGARIQTLAMEALSGIRWWGGLLGLIGALRISYPPLKDLEPGSEVLLKMLSDTDEAVASPGGTCLLATKVLHGVEDNVIVQASFSKDPEETVIARKGHRTICKPASDFLQPVGAVLEVL